MSLSLAVRILTNTHKHTYRFQQENHAAQDDPWGDEAHNTRAYGGTASWGGDSAAMNAAWDDNDNVPPALGFASSATQPQQVGHDLLFLCVRVHA